MNYWEGIMNWALDKDWKCEICGGDYGLTWGLVHGECRCNQCHAVYSMRADDEARTILTKPRCSIKESFRQPAKQFYSQTRKPLEDATKDDWIKLGVPENEFNKEKEESHEKP